MLNELRVKRIACLPVAIVVALAVVPALAGDGAAPAAGAADILQQAGTDFEAARRLAPEARGTALEAVARTIADLDPGKLPEARRAAALLLRGEIDYATGEFGAAEDEFRQAAKKSDDDALDAVASFARVQALEAAGDDDKAADEWRKWLKKHPDDPRAAEAELYLGWNHLRRGELDEAGEHLRAAGEKAAWLATDRRFVLAEATHAFLSGLPDDALAWLDKVEPDAAVTYLRALCFHANGDVLKAAAAFQEVEQRYPDSSLRDPAMLAKANTFLESGAYSSAAEEMARVRDEARDPAVSAEAALRQAAAVFLAGDGESAEPLLREVVADHEGTDVAARAQYLLGEVMLAAGRHEDAILEFNRVLSRYFDQSVAASAQYRVGRCLDALGRQAEATSAYQAVVAGYPLEPEAPAAAYLAGVGLMELDRPQAAIPCFQLVLDRYAGNEDSNGTVVFASPEHQELVEASLCLLELSYHRVGDLGQLAGAPHLLLKKTPASASPWRAYALLIDADAMAAQGLHEEARASIERLFREYPDHPADAPAMQLLAWIQAEQGDQDQAVRTVEQMLVRYGTQGDPAQLSQAYLNLAHVRFNQKHYEEAASSYEDFLQRYPKDDKRLLALYQVGLCYLRLGRDGDAVDRWEALVAADPAAEIAERAWVRAGDLYFQAEHYEDAKRCYEGLLANFAGSSAAALGQLRIAQCDFNAGDDASALKAYAAVTERYPGTPMAEEAERGLESALYRLGQRAEGVEELRALVRDHPGSAFAADAQFRIARRLYEQESFSEAAEEFRRVISRYPGFESADRAQYLMGDAHARAGDDASARQDFEQFLIFFGESDLRTTVRFRLGMLYFEADEYMRAAVNFTGVLDEQPERDTAAAALFNLGLCRRLLGDHEAAAADLKRYRALYGDDERAVQIASQLADIHEQAGRWQEAVSELERALGARPPAQLATEFQYRLGSCYEGMSDIERAISAYGKAAASREKSNPFRLSALARCAALCEVEGKYKEALAAYRDLMKNAQDPELVAAATGRAAELAAVLE